MKKSLRVAGCEFHVENEVTSKNSQTSFPQAKRVGNPSENKERFRTSRNDKITIGCGFSNDFLNNKGIALMMVLWVLVLLGIITLNYFNYNRWNSASTRNMKEETRSYYLAVSGYNEALNYIMSDKDTSFDFIDDEENFWVDKETQPVTGKRSTGDGEIDIKITDEDSRININFANTEQLKKLLLHAGISQESTIEIIDSILDWKDPDKEHHLSGAEDEYYEGLEEPYKAKNTFFDLPEELALVKGIKPEYIYGGGEGKSILPLITTFGRGNININTVSKEVMEFLGLSVFEIEAIMKQRNKEAGGFRFIPQQFALYGLNSISSNNLKIEVTATASNSKMSSRIVAVVKRQPVAKGYKVQTVYWRESAENIRS